MLTPLEFCYKLQGFAEIQPRVPTNAQWKRIKTLITDVDPESEEDFATQGMQPAKFVHWLLGFIEIGGDTGNILPEQWQIVVDHLQAVFIKITPDRTNDEDADKDTLDILKKILEEKDKEINPFPNPYAPPLPWGPSPNPWKKDSTGDPMPFPPTIICKADSDIGGGSYCCSSVKPADELTKISNMISSSGFSGSGSSGTMEDAYERGMGAVDDADLGSNPLK